MGYAAVLVLKLGVLTTDIIDYTLLLSAHNLKHGDGSMLIPITRGSLFTAVSDPYHPPYF
jgi:hypothetical protein